MRLRENLEAGFEERQANGPSTHTLYLGTIKKQRKKILQRISMCDTTYDLKKIVKSMWIIMISSLFHDVITSIAIFELVFSRYYYNYIE